MQADLVYPLIYGEFDNDFVIINETFEVTAGLANPSSRLLKYDFKTLSAASVLNKLSAMEITQWRYKHRPKELHVGPVAEDFYHAFGLGDGEKRISTIDADGILMLAVQALKSENDVLQSKLKDLQKQIDQLKLTIEK